MYPIIHKETFYTAYIPHSPKTHIVQNQLVNSIPIKSFDLWFEQPKVKVSAKMFEKTLKRNWKYPSQTTRTQSVF